MEKFSFENAQNEALKMQDKIKNGEAKNYSDAEKIADKRKITPSDFFKEDPNKEYSLYKSKRNPAKPIEEVTMWSTASSTWPDYNKINDLYSHGGEIPYTSIHNHPHGSELLNSTGDYNHSLPSFGDLYVFLRDDEMETTAIYQHSQQANKTEGLYVIKKTKKTPRTGINYSNVAKGLKDPRDVDIKLNNEHHDLVGNFELGILTEALNDYHALTMNPHHSDIPQSEKPMARHILLKEICKKLDLQIKFIPAKGYYYSPGIGFLKEEKA